MQQLMTLINHILEKLLMLMMFFIIATVTWQVFSRFILQSPSSYTEELARYLLIWIGILGAAYAYRTKAHLGLDIVVQKLQPAKQKLARIIVECMVIIFAVCILIYGGLNLVSITLELKQTSAALGLQMGYVYTVIPISGCLICLFSFSNIINLVNHQGAK
ncbi:TRAP transporter small permease [Paraglaciecola aquimarina]|uniref:TRAP transporter small permease protein n=1 Tax=Paraglaciecola algarum TaxID=3050085 RepID=A0ABS9DB43_9ALTE|nr:TRAP transporter small permease [Paraglaciecola sp. G1-23]MCF2949590.1 TRAP transporter small permease [Paraglaciecola sp. G1-23]